MGFILSIVFCVMASCFFYKERNIFAPGVAFSYIWGFIVLISNFQISKYNKIYIDTNMISIKTYSIIAIGVCSFALGCIIRKKYKIKYPLRKNSRQYSYRVANKKVYFIFLIICMVGGFIECRTSIKYLLNGGAINELYRLLAVSTVYNSNENTNQFIMSATESRIVNFVVEPLMFVIIPYSLFRFFKDNKIKYLLIASVIEIIYLLSHMGRASVMIFVFYVLFFVYLHKNKSNGLKVNFKDIKNRIIIICSLIAFIYICSVRGTQIVSTVISYFGYPLLHMQKKMELISEYGNTYGYYSFLGYFQLVFGAMEEIGMYIPKIFSVAQNYVALTDAATILPNGVIYNAFVTIFYSFYIDFGFFGVFIMSILFGYFCQAMYSKLVEKSDEFSVTIYALLFSYSILFSFVRFQFTKSNYALAFIAILILFSDRRWKRTNNYERKK